MLQRALWLSLWLAAAPLAAQLPDLASYHPGALHLALSEAHASQIEIDLTALEAVLCGSSNEAQRGAMPPGETCRLVIANDGSHGGLLRGDGDADVVAAAATLFRPPCAGAQVTVVPTQLSLKGVEPIALSCGSWSFTAEVHVGLSAPPSILTLLPAPFGSPTGFFAGPLNVLMDFTFRDTLSGASYSETRSLVLDASGRWTVIQGLIDAPYALPPSETNLALFVDREGTGGPWLRRPGCALARKGCTRLCLQGSAEAVLVLNAEGASGS